MIANMYIYIYATPELKFTCKLELTLEDSEEGFETYNSSVVISKRFTSNHKSYVL